MQAAMFDLNSAIACQAPPKRFSDTFTKVGKDEEATWSRFRAGSTPRSSPSPGPTRRQVHDRRFRVIRHGKVVARTREGAQAEGEPPPRRHVHHGAGQRPGAREAALQRGASKLSAPGTPVSLTTQVTRSERSADSSGGAGGELPHALLAPRLEVGPLLAAELGGGLVGEPPLAADPVPVARGARAGRAPPARRTPCAGPSARWRAGSRGASGR